MALSILNFESKYLNGNTGVSVILPDRARDTSPAEFYASGKKYKVLWLLHGTFGDHTDWLRRSNIETYACERELMVVMPSVQNSDYSNWPNFACGFDAERFLIEELMPLVHNWFPASSRREDNFIAGLSMGGQGAARYAAWYPEKFAAAAILSGSPHNWRTLSKEDLAFDRTKNQIAVEGGMKKLLSSHTNIWDRIGKLAGTGTLPKFYVTSGTDDFLYDCWYLPFKSYAQEIGLDAVFEEVEHYGHEWRFWDLAIQRALDFFGLENTASGNEF